MDGSLVNRLLERLFCGEDGYKEHYSGTAAIDLDDKGKPLCGTPGAAVLPDTGRRTFVHYPCTLFDGAAGLAYRSMIDRELFNRNSLVASMPDEVFVGRIASNPRLNDLYRVYFSEYARPREMDHIVLRPEDLKTGLDAEQQRAVEAFVRERAPKAKGWPQWLGGDWRLAGLEGAWLAEVADALNRSCEVPSRGSRSKLEEWVDGASPAAGRPERRVLRGLLHDPRRLEGLPDARQEELLRDFVDSSLNTLRLSSVKPGVLKDKFENAWPPVESDERTIARIEAVRRSPFAAEVFVLEKIDAFLDRARRDLQRWRGMERGHAAFRDLIVEPRFRRQGLFQIYKWQNFEAMKDIVAMVAEEYAAVARNSAWVEGFRDVAVAAASNAALAALGREGMPVKARVRDAFDEASVTDEFDESLDRTTKVAALAYIVVTAVVYGPYVSFTRPNCYEQERASEGTKAASGDFFFETDRTIDAQSGFVLVRDVTVVGGEPCKNVKSVAQVTFDDQTPDARLVTVGRGLDYDEEECPHDRKIDAAAFASDAPDPDELLAARWANEEGLRRDYSFSEHGEGVSRLHFGLTVVNKALYLVDFASTNGTFVNRPKEGPAGTVFERILVKAVRPGGPAPLDPQWHGPALRLRRGDLLSCGVETDGCQALVEIV